MSVVNVAKEDKGVVGDEGHFVLEVGLLDDGCPDFLLLQCWVSR